MDKTPPVTMQFLPIERPLSSRTPPQMPPSRVHGIECVAVPQACVERCGRFWALSRGPEGCTRFHELMQDPTEHVKWWRIDIAKAWGVDWIVRAALQNELG